MVKKGEFVEYTDKYYRDYPPEDDSVIKYGVCLRDSDSTNPVPVETVNGTDTAMYIYACGWAGWVPDEKLYEIQSRIMGETNSE